MSLNDARSKIIAKSYSPEVSVEEFLEKGKKANLGEVREWQGKKVQKTTQGWVLYNDKNGGHEKKHQDSTDLPSHAELKNLSVGDMSGNDTDSFEITKIDNDSITVKSSLTGKSHIIESSKKEEKPEAPKTGVYMAKNYEGNMVKMTKKPSGDYLVDGRMVYKRSDFKSDGEYYETRFGTFTENKPTNRNTVTGEEYSGNGKPQDAIDLRDQVKATVNPKSTEAQVTMKVLDEMKISIPDSGLRGMRMDVSGNMNMEDFSRQIKKYITNSPQKVKEAFTEDFIKQLHQDAIVSMLHSAADRDGLFIGNYVNSDRIKEALSNAKKATRGELTKSEAMQILGI